MNRRQEPLGRRAFRDIIGNVRETSLPAEAGSGDEGALTGEIHIAQASRPDAHSRVEQLGRRPPQEDEVYAVASQERRVLPLLMRDAQTGNPVDISFAQSLSADEAERLRERSRRSPMGSIDEVPIDITFANQPPEGLTFVVHEVEGDDKRDRYFRVTPPKSSAGNLQGVFVVPLTPREAEQFLADNGTVVELAEIQQLHSSTRGVLSLVVQKKLTKEHLAAFNRDRHMAAPGGRRFPEGSDLPEPRLSQGDKALFARRPRSSGR